MGLVAIVWDRIILDSFTWACPCHALPQDVSGQRVLKCPLPLVFSCGRSRPSEGWVVPEPWQSI